jgi:hypothetical protein
MADVFAANNAAGDEWIPDVRMTATARMVRDPRPRGTARQRRRTIQQRMQRRRRMVIRFDFGS